jgi:hypothetical protein
MGESADCRGDHQADSEAKSQSANHPADQVLAGREGLECRVYPEGLDYRGRAAAQDQHQAQPSEEATKDGESPRSHDVTVVHDVASCTTTVVLSCSSRKESRRRAGPCRTGSVKGRRSRSRSALRFRETPTMAGGGSGSALLPEPRRRQVFDFPTAKPRLALVALALAPVGRLRIRQLAGSLRRVPRAGLPWGADLAASSRAGASARGRAAA